jgi:hypothetical protein
MSDFPQVLIWASNNVFGILASIAGIVVACVLWSRASRAAALLLAASVLQLLVLLFMGWFYMALLPQLVSVGGAARTLMWSGLGAGLLHAVVYVLLILAVATGRRHYVAPPAATQG